MCEHRNIDDTERILYMISPLDVTHPNSYYKTLKARQAAWIRLTSGMNKNQFHDILYPLKLTDEQKEHLWLIICYCHYHLESPTIFFDFLMEVAIEERASLRSFSTAEAIHQWPKNPIPEKFQNNFLLFLYLAIRDGRRAFTFLETLDLL